jgi:hypothetical protein
MPRFPALILAIVFVVLAAAPARALDPNLLASALPEHYDGVYVWVGDDGRQDVSVTINRTTVDGDGSVLAFGDGKYETRGLVLFFSMVWKIEPKSLRIEIWEASPTSNVEFINDGSHVGVISEDLTTVSTVWTTNSNGQQGTLVMRSR